MAFPTVSRLAQLLLEKNDLPITVIQLVKISPLVTDARYIQCTDKAAELYGLEDRHSLIGDYFSYHHTPDDYERGKVLSLAAKLGRIVPDVYISRLQRPDGEIVSVKKHTTRNFLEHGAVEWITYLELIREDPGMPAPDIDALGLSQADLEAFAGRYNVAEMEHILQQHQVSPFSTLGRKNSPLQGEFVSNILDDNVSHSKGKCVTLTEALSNTMDGVITVTGGKHKGQQRQPNHCLRCSWRWWSVFGKRPPQCSNCKDKNWDRPPKLPKKQKLPAL